MPEEVLRLLAVRPGGRYLDGTLGGGGHSSMIAEHCLPEGGMLIGVDRDPEALRAAAALLSGPAGLPEGVRLVHGNFADIESHLAGIGVDLLDGFLLDLGVSSYQLDTPERGFSFQQDAPLDMRMDPTGGETAADLLNGLSEDALERIIRDYGEERWARRIAAFIVRERAERPIERTLQLVDLIKGAVPRAKWEERIHPATRTFQALRIAVNGELESVERGLRAALDHLRPGGRGVVISFHSLEDRLVKHIFREYAAGCTCPRSLPVCVCGKRPTVRILTGRPLTAQEGEVGINVRSRSAKLRAVEKL